MRTTRETAERTRRAIVDAALVMFAERGYADTSFAELGVTVGMTRGAVHHHFRDKQELLGETLRDQWAVWSQPVLAPLAGRAEPEPAIADFVAGYLRLLATDPTFRALAVVTTQVAPGVVGTGERVASEAVVLDAWREALARRLGGAAGPDGCGVVVLMNFLVGATQTAVAQPGLLPDEQRAARIATELARLAVRLDAS